MKFKGVKISSSCSSNTALVSYEVLCNVSAGGKYCISMVSKAVTAIKECPNRGENKASFDDSSHGDGHQGKIGGGQTEYLIDLGEEATPY